MKVWLRDSVKVGVKFGKWVHFSVQKNVFFLDGKGQNSLSNHKQVMIGQHKSIEVVKIHWFCNSSLLLGKKIRHKTTKIPVLQKLTHMRMRMMHIAKNCRMAIPNCNVSVFDP